LRPIPAGSAREIAERGDKTCASIATRLAAEIYGLDILAENVEDEAHNTTRFIVLSREKAWAPRGKGKVVTTFCVPGQERAGGALQGHGRLSRPTAST